MPEAAPIAAKYEDCVQNFARFCVAVESNSSPTDSTLADDSYAKFLAWGSDSRASSRSLDYNLRKTSDLRDRTLELLVILHSTLRKSKF